MLCALVDDQDSSSLMSTPRLAGHPQVEEPRREVGVFVSNCGCSLLTKWKSTIRHPQVEGPGREVGVFTHCYCMPELVAPQA